jgi:hypothetical protein
MAAAVTYAHDLGATVGGFRTLKWRLAHGWVADWSSLRALVVWVRV